MRVKLAFLWAVLLQFVPASSAAGSPEVIFETDAPTGSCAVPIEFIPCVVGHDMGREPSLADDTFYVSPVVRRLGFQMSNAQPDLDGLSVGFDRGEVTAPIHARAMVLDALEEIDDRLGNRLSYEELGPWIIWVTVQSPVPGAEQVGFPVASPFIEKDGLRLKTGSDTYGSDDSLLYVATFGDRCFFQDNLPDNEDRLCTNIDGAPAAELLTTSIPNLQLGYWVEEVFVRATNSSSTSDAPSDSVGAAGNLEASRGLGLGGGEPEFYVTAEGASERLAGAWGIRTTGPAHASAPPVLGEAAVHSEDLASVLVLAALAFLPLPLWRLYRRMKTRACLDHDFRTAILREVRHQPGVQPAELARRLACSFKTVTHHLTVLRSFGHVDLERRGNALHVFERGVHPQVVKGLYVSRQPTRLRVLRLVAARPGIGCSAIARELGMSKPGVHSHLKALERDRVLQRRGRRGWEVAPEAQQAWHVVAEVAQPAPQPSATGPIS